MNCRKVLEVSHVSAWSVVNIPIYLFRPSVTTQAMLSYFLYWLIQVPWFSSIQSCRLADLDFTLAAFPFHSPKQVALRVPRQGYCCSQLEKFSLLCFQLQGLTPFARYSHCPRHNGLVHKTSFRRRSVTQSRSDCSRRYVSQTLDASLALKLSRWPKTEAFASAWLLSMTSLIGGYSTVALNIPDCTLC